MKKLSVLSTRDSLIREVSKKSGIKILDCKTAFDSLLSTILLHAEKAKNGKEAHIEIRGFGTFFTKIRKPKLAARNPRNGDPTPIPSRRVLLWRPSKDITLEMNRRQE